jgi:hypothetical protein
MGSADNRQTPFLFNTLNQRPVSSHNGIPVIITAYPLYMPVIHAVYVVMPARPRRRLRGHKIRGRGD